MLVDSLLRSHCTPVEEPSAYLLHHDQLFFKDTPISNTCSMSLAYLPAHKARVWSTQAVQLPGKDQARTHALTHSKFWMYSTSTRVFSVSASRMASMCGGRTSEDTYCFRRRTRPSAWKSREFARISSHSRATCLFYTAHTLSQPLAKLIKQQWVHCCGQALPVQGVWDREHL